MDPSALFESTILEAELQKGGIDGGRRVSSRSIEKVEYSDCVFQALLLAENVGCFFESLVPAEAINEGVFVRSKERAWKSPVVMGMRS